MNVDESSETVGDGVLRRDQMGGAFGLSLTVFILLGSVGPAVIGIGSEFASFDAVFVALSIGLAVSGGVLFATMRYIGGN